MLGRTLTKAELSHATDAVNRVKQAMEELPPPPFDDATAEANSDRQPRLRSMLIDVLDFEVMARFVLGHHRKTITEPQWQAFLFEYRELVLSGRELPLSQSWTGKVEIVDVRAFGKEDFLVSVDLQQEGINAERIALRMRRREESVYGYKVIDAYVEGLSLLQTQRSAYDGVLRDMGIDGLTALLGSKGEPGEN